MLHHMIGGLAALILLSRLSQNEDVPHKIPVRVVNQGDNVTLTCPASADNEQLFEVGSVSVDALVESCSSVLNRLKFQEIFGSYQEQRVSEVSDGRDGADGETEDRSGATAAAVEVIQRRWVLGVREDGTLEEHRAFSRGRIIGMSRGDTITFGFGDKIRHK
ncbi:hypothetical protein D4764_0116890 [Takifugu flavidus]|uniref:Uncharacterized protein n=1 Tax=Takifugu flavidus TaxID=433684 RepID=A0A5C6MED9_9TELE|nr:hypothetical protein D4764_0116890 [Takifugu flavidus]